MSAALMPIAAARGGAEREALLAQLNTICRSARADGSAARRALATGFAALDAVLPGGGWPCAALTELMPETMGIGELSLLMPALARVSTSGRYLAWVAPPWRPCAPALAAHGLALERLLLVRASDTDTALWAVEQLLRCTHIGAVLAWPGTLDERRVRRLQLAAERGGGCGMLYRPPRAAALHSPAALRLRLQPAPAGLAVQIQKARGGNAGALLTLPLAGNG